MYDKVVPIQIYLAVWISKARLHEDAVGIGGIALRVLSLGTTWRRVDRLRTLTTFLQRKKNTWVTNCIGCWMNTRASADCVGKTYVCCFSRESNPGPSVDQSIVYLLYRLCSRRLYARERDGKICCFLIVEGQTILCITHTVEHKYISPSNTVGIQLHVSALYVGHLQVEI